MYSIPITFEQGEEKYTGYFTQVAGAGSSSVWHLMDDKSLYKGRLRKQNEQWVFDSSKDNLSGLADFFADYIIAWIQ